MISQRDFFYGILYGVSSKGKTIITDSEALKTGFLQAYRSLTAQEESQLNFNIVPEEPELVGQLIADASRSNYMAKWSSGEYRISPFVEKKAKNLPFSKKRCKELGQIVIDSFEPRN